jgi:predicted TPR repeat methyltransferase
MSSSRTWDRLAQADPMGSISTSSRGRDENVFWSSGERTASFILELVAPHLGHRAVAVDIGAGIGRIAIPMARQFERVRAVDVSDVMLAKLRSTCEQFGVTNIESYRTDGHWDAGPADLVYSVLTFQHVEHLTVIETTIARIAGCLRGVAYVQFDTRPQTFASQVKERLPDWCVPWTWKRGMRRYRRDPEAIRRVCAGAGLRVVREVNLNAALHGFLLEPEDRSCGGCASVAAVLP